MEVYKLQTLLHTGLALLLVVALGCEQAPRSSDSEPDSVLPLTIGIAEGIFTSVAMLTEEQDYFRQAGLDPNIKHYQSGKAALQAVLNGEVDVGTSADAPIMAASLKRQDFAILATFCYSDTDGKIVARRDHGVAHPIDLAGKTIGVTKGTTAHFLVEQFLTDNGILPTSADLIDTKPGELREKLAAGEFDAISTWEPRAIDAAIHLGENAIVFAPDNLIRHTFNVVASRSAIDSKKPALKRLLSAMAQGVQFAEQQPEKTQSIVARRLGLSSDKVAGLWNQYHQGLFLDQELILNLEAEARWHLTGTGGDPGNVPNYLEYIEPSFLYSLKPGSVTLNR